MLDLTALSSIDGKGKTGDRVVFFLASRRTTCRVASLYNCPVRFSSSGEAIGGLHPSCRARFASERVSHGFGNR